MRQRVLGNTQISVSEISFGCVELGIPYGFTSHSTETMLRPEEAVELLHCALERGINFFDTAPAYGTAEGLLGEAFHDRRDEVVICTKATHELFKEDGSLLPGDELEASIRKTLGKSLKALQRDYVDVFLSHRVTDEILGSSVFADVFKKLKDEGLVKAVGLSTYGVKQTQATLDAGCWDVIQVAYNLFDQTHDELIQQAHEQGVGIMVRSVLFRGILTDNCPELGPNLQRVQEHYDKLRALVPDGMSLSELATKFVMSHPGVSSTLVGIDRMEYLEAALKIGQASPLSPELYEKARGLAFPDPDFLDLPKWNRLGWLT